MTPAGETGDVDARRAERVRRLTEAFIADEAVSTLRHDLISHLTGIGTVAYLLRKRIERTDAAAPPDASTPDLLRMIREQVSSATAKLERRLVPPAEGEAPRADVEAAVDRVIRTLALPAAVVVEETYESADLVATIHEIEIEIALRAILDNAIEATEEAGGGVVRVHCSRSDSETLAVDIEDEGKGFSGERPSRAFDAFCTTKSEHVGLGLSVALRIAQRWAGSVALGTADGGGARVSLRLPAVRRNQE